MDRDRTGAPLDNDAPIPSMSNDNTSSTPADPQATRLLNEVHEGMEVVDANNEKLGSVEYVAMGDPDAVTIDSTNPARDYGLVGDIARVFAPNGGEPDVPPQFQAHLLRVGFFKVDGPGWIDTDRYVTPDRIAGVTNDTVRLNVTKDAVMTED